MEETEQSGDDSQRDSVSDESFGSPEPGPVSCMGPFLVRRLSCRTIQLPPLAFRQAEQYYYDRKPEPDTVTVPPRPTTLSIRTPPLIAITDTSRLGKRDHSRSEKRIAPYPENEMRFGRDRHQGSNQLDSEGRRKQTRQTACCI